MILKAFAERPDEVISREDLLETVWGYEAFPSTRTIDNFILRLRKRFEFPMGLDAPEICHARLSFRGTLFAFRVRCQCPGASSRGRNARQGVKMLAQGTPRRKTDPSGVLH